MLKSVLKYRCQETKLEVVRQAAGGSVDSIMWEQEKQQGEGGKGGRDSTEDPRGRLQLW